MDISHVPYFKITNERQNPRLDKPTVVRRSVYVIVKHHIYDRYLLINRKDKNAITFIYGGVEDGEDVAQAAAREVQEETGYQNVRLIRTLDEEIHGHYYAPHKDENRYAIITGCYFELLDEQQSSLQDYESGLHEPVRLAQDEVYDRLYTQMNNYSRRKFLGEKPENFDTIPRINQYTSDYFGEI